MNIAEVRAILTHISMTYDRATPPGKEEAWLVALDDLDFELARAATFAVCRTSEFPPNPAQIRNAAQQITSNARAEEQRRARAALAAAKAPDTTAQRTADGAAMIAYALGRHEEIRAATGALRLSPAEAQEIAEAAITEWRAEHPAPPIAARTGAHCESPKCRCTHTEGCDGGWIGEGLPSGEHTPARPVRPCRACRPRAFALLADARSYSHAGTQLRDTTNLDKEHR